MPRRKKRFLTKRKVERRALGTGIEVVPLEEPCEEVSSYGYCKLPDGAVRERNMFSNRRERTLLSITTWDGRNIFQLDTKS